VTSSDADRYTVRRWSGLLALGFQVGVVLVVGLVLGGLQDRMLVNLVTIAVVVVLGALAWDRATLALRVDAAGITWSRPTARVLLSGAEVRFLPWASVHELVIVDGAVVRASVRADASLPGWLRGRVVDPVDPESQPVVAQGDAPGVDADRLHKMVKRIEPDILCRVSVSGESEPGR
jgi:hypothetical protein